MPPLGERKERRRRLSSTTALLLLLALICPSCAVFNPLDNPQNHHHHSAYQEQHEEYYHDAQPTPPRGGSTRTIQISQAAEQQKEVPFEPPKIRMKHMSMALRLTCEWNRRLSAGVNRFRFLGKNKGKTNSDERQEQQNIPVNINPSRPWNPPIPEYSNDLGVEELTIFHAKTPRETESPSDELRRGVARWGPELLPYLEHVVKMLGISSKGVEIPLAMIYLDRACSVETIRSNGSPPCPFCMPRTVHRLSLIALLLATQAAGSQEKTMDEHFQDLESLGIPVNQLEQMVDWMRSALGDDGLFVTVGQMRVWSQNWNAIFFPKPQQDKLTSSQQPQQLQQQQLQQVYEHP